MNVLTSLHTFLHVLANRKRDTAIDLSKFYITTYFNFISLNNLMKFESLNVIVLVNVNY